MSAMNRFIQNLNWIFGMFFFWYAAISAFVFIILLVAAFQVQDPYYGRWCNKPWSRLAVLFVIPNALACYLSEPAK